jgi:hypothetical protein
MDRGGLARLVEALAAQTGFPWIRFLYAYPRTLDDSVLDLMAREGRFVPYVDIPLQHVSRAVLSGMRRGGDRASYRAMIARMRERVPDIAIRTTFILGFPGEGEVEFGELVEFVREAEFDNLGAFTYSPEPGSGSEPLGDPVPAEDEPRRIRRGPPAGRSGPRPEAAPAAPAVDAKRPPARSRLKKPAAEGDAKAAEGPQPEAAASAPEAPKKPPPMKRVVKKSTGGSNDASTS